MYINIHKNDRLNKLKHAVFIVNLSTFYSYDSLCIFEIDRPLGSFMFLKASSHSRACGVLHATEGTEGTDFAAASLGKCSLKIDL